MAEDNSPWTFEQWRDRADMWSRQVEHLQRELDAAKAARWRAIDMVKRLSEPEPGSDLVAPPPTTGG